MIGARPKWPRSAYNASAPVTASTTAASAKNAMREGPDKNPIAYVGRQRLEDLGMRAMPEHPQAPIARNQTIMIGPNTRPTGCGPEALHHEEHDDDRGGDRHDQWSSDGSTTSRPSTADSTEIAGVIMLSPKNSDAPKMPSATRIACVRRLPRTPCRRIKVISARMPPSPSLSARSTSSTYLMRDDDRHRPEDQRHEAVDVVRRRRDGMRVVRVEHRLDRVDRARADVAEHDAEGADPQRQPAKSSLLVSVRRLSFPSSCLPWRS